MSPRAPYRPPRPRREVVTAAVASAGVVAFTVVMVWVLGPHSSGSSSPSGPSLSPTPTTASTRPSTPPATTPTTGSSPSSTATTRR